MNEEEGPLIVAPPAAQEEVAQAQAQAVAVVEPPVDGLPLGVDAVTSTKLD
jgi:hypothetical protein